MKRASSVGMGLKNALTSLSFRARSLRLGVASANGGNGAANAAVSSTPRDESSVAASVFGLENGDGDRSPSHRHAYHQHRHEALESSSGRESAERWNLDGRVGSTQPNSSSPQPTRKNNGAYQPGNSMFSLRGLLLRSRSALDVRHIYNTGLETTSLGTSVPSAEAALYGSRLAAMVERGSPRSAVARRIQVGLQELADLVELTRRGSKVGYEGRKPYLVDVREPHELELRPGIPGSINIPLSVLKASLALSPDDFNDTFLMEKPDMKNCDVVFYGRGPNHSMTALEIAHKSGYKVSRHFPGGVSSWESYMNNFGVVDLF